jgi:hypothetical protein
MSWRFDYVRAFRDWYDMRRVCCITSRQLSRCYRCKGAIEKAMVGYFRIAEPNKKPWIIGVHEAATLGRDNDNDIVLEHQAVSRYHAIVQAQLGRVMLIDLGSTNGTLVNDTLMPADEPIWLRHGDRIRIGPIELSYEVPIRNMVSYLDRAAPNLMWMDLGARAGFALRV